MLEVLNTNAIFYSMKMNKTTDPFPFTTKQLANLLVYHKKMTSIKVHAPPGSPSHTSSQSYLQSPSLPGRGSFSRSKVRKVRVTSMLGGTMIMKEHSRLWGYLSGKPGDSMRPEGLVKLREQSEPRKERQIRQRDVS